MNSNYDTIKYRAIVKEHDMRMIKELKIRDLDLDQEEKEAMEYVSIAVEFTGKKAPWSITPIYSGHSVRLNYNARKTTFEFYGSMVKPECTEDEIPFMLYSFLGDALTWYEYSFEEFMSEFGYDREFTSSIEKARIAYTACEDSYNNACYIFGNSDILYEIMNYLMENYEL
jgi:hypothetical protein